MIKLCIFVSFANQESQEFWDGNIDHTRTGCSIIIYTENYKSHKSLNPTSKSEIEAELLEGGTSM